MVESIKESITAESGGIGGERVGDAGSLRRGYLEIFQLSRLLQYSVSLSCPDDTANVEEEGRIPPPFRFRGGRLVVFLRLYW